MRKIHSRLAGIERLKLCLLACIFLVLGSSKTHAQKLIFENIGVRSGLPSTEVYNLFQDNKGYLWIFTEYGIVKFNGTNYFPVCKNLSLKESAVYGVAASNNGNMFIVNATGNIYRIFKDKAYKITGTEATRKMLKKTAGIVCDLFLDNQNGLYFSTYEETFYYPASKYQINGLKKEKVKKSRKEKLYPVRISNSKLPGKVFSSVKVIDGSRKTVINWNKRTMYNTRLISRKWKDINYLCSQLRIESRNSKGETRTVEFGCPTVSMEIDKNGHVWVSLIEGGLIEFDSQLNMLERYFDKIIISDILFDNQGGMWVSTIGKGVYHCKDINQKSYNNIPELRDSYISLLREMNNRLFIGTYSGSLFQQREKMTKKINVGINSSIVTDVLYLDGKYLISSGKPLIIADENFHVKKFYDGAMYGLAKVDDETALLVIANSIGKYQLNEKNHLVKNLFEIPRVRSVSKRFGNEFFVTSPQGILHVKDFKFSFPGYLDLLKDKSISRVVSDGYDNVWFCSKGNGIYCLDTGDKLHHYTNLPAKIVNDICFTKEDQIVIATNKGVFAASKSKIAIKSAWKLILNEESSRLTEFEHQLFIGTKRGLTSMNCAELVHSKKYRFHLSSIASRGKYLSIKKDIVANYNQNDLYLSYDLLNFHTNDKQLEYKLVGPTQLNDVVTGTRLHLQNLSPGEYTLYVNPLMNNTKVSDLQIATKFTIRPAFWQTWIFRIVAAVILLSVIFLLFWWINNRRNKKIQEVNQIENLLTEYRLTALKSQVNPHFMSNSLVAIQRLILEDETDKANQYIAKFSLLLRSLLEYSNRSSATIRNELRMIELYVELEQLRFSNHFLFEVQIDPEINLDTTYMPALITQPFVENAIWHGLLPLGDSKQAKLVLSVVEYEKGIVISVKDNGVGRSFNTEKKKHGEFESRGTSLIIQRIENLGRLYNSKDARIDFVDLTDEAGEPAGTKVDIVLPDEILIQLYERRNS